MNELVLTHSVRSILLELAFLLTPIAILWWLWKDGTLLQHAGAIAGYVVFGWILLVMIRVSRDNDLLRAIEATPNPSTILVNEYESDGAKNFVVGVLGWCFSLAYISILLVPYSLLRLSRYYLFRRQK